MGRRWAVVLLVALSSAAAACSGERPREPALSQAWKLSAITPLGQPAAVGDTVVVYGTVGDNVYLYGVGVADGAIRWRQAATPSAMLRGIAMVPAVVAGHPVYLRPDNRLAQGARMVVAAPESGDDVLVSDVSRFRSSPKPCADGKDICVTMADSAGRSTTRRFSVEAGGPVPDPGQVPPGARYVGDDLLDLGPRQPEVLAGFRDGKVQWQSPLGRHLPPGHSTDFGWHFERYDSQGVYVGSVGRRSNDDDPKAVVVDLTRFQMAAIDAATGASAWRNEGAGFACGSRIALPRAVGPDRGELWPVRCRYRGIARYDRASEAATFDGLDVTVEGFDLRTGLTTWSLALGPAAAFLERDANASPVSDSEALVQGATGPVIVDVATGAARPPGKGEVFWCADDVWFDDGGVKRRGGTHLEPCAADRSPVASVPATIPAALGATVGARTVLAGPQGLVAYDRRARGGA